MSVATESLRRFKRYIPGIVLGILLGVVVNVCIALAPLIPTLLIDKVINPALGADKANSSNVFSILLNGYAPDDYWGMFIVLAILFVVILAIKHIFSYIRWNVLQWAGTKAENDLRGKVFQKIVTQNSLVMSKYASGDLVTIAGSDVRVVKDFYAEQIVYFLGVLQFWGLSAYFLSTINWLLMIVPVVGGIVSLFVMRSYSQASRQRFKVIRDSTGDLSTTVQENIQGVRVVRAYATEELELAKFDQQNKAVTNAHIYGAKIKAKYGVIFSTISNAIFFCSMIVAIVLALDNQITFGQFATFFAYVQLISFPFQTLADVLSELQNFVVSGTRLFNFLNADNAISDGTLTLPTEANPSPNLTIHNASVKIDGTTILQDITVDIPYGKKLGIMGKTGSGKSTFVKMLNRFVDCTNEGSISINGIDIKDLQVEVVRRQYGFVMQDVFLFSDSATNNIAFFDPFANPQDIQKVAEIADAHNFVSELINGYDTIIGEKGVGLSGGQKQRISIARALLKNAPILLFDDCTSALDIETERKILSGIKTHYPQKSIVITSHRATSVKDCDEILYFEDGKIIERGTHTDLINQQGKYYEIYTAQEATQIARLKDYID